MTMCGEEPAAMLPEPRPDAFAIGLRDVQSFQSRAREKLEPAFLHRRWQFFQAGLQLEQEHEPVGLPLETVFADESGEMKISRAKIQAEFLVRFPRSTGVGRFAFVCMQLAATRTPEAAIRLLGAFEQEHFIALIKAIEQRGDLVRQLHARSEAIAARFSKRFVATKKKPGQ